MDSLDVPAWLTGFFDDAAVFPPASVPLEIAVAAHRAHRRSEYSGLVGSLVVPDGKLVDLIDVLDDQEDEDEALAVSLLVTGGAGAIGPAVHWAGRAPHLQLRAIELALRDEEDLARNAQRFLTALDAVDQDLSQVQVFVELPPWYGSPTHGWLSALDEIAAGELAVKFRTGGASAEGFPIPEDLVACFDAALDRELRFKCTGGLDAALPRFDPATGFAHHGAINLLVAIRACLDGEDAIGALRETSAEALLSGIDPEALLRTRRWLLAVGTSDVLEPHHDLIELGLL